MLDQKFALQCGLIGRGELRDGDQKRSCAVRACQPFQRGAHHLRRSRGVEIHDIRVQTGQHRHRLFDGVRNVMQLEVQKDPMTAGLDLAHNGRALGIEELHADLHEGLPFGETVQKGQSLRRGRKIAGDDDVFSHVMLLSVHEDCECRTGPLLPVKPR